MRTTIELETVCPFCKEVHECASPVPGITKLKVPENGSLSFCFKCGEWSIFDSFWKGGLRKPKPAEYTKIGLDKKLQIVRESWIEVMKDKL